VDGRFVEELRIKEKLANAEIEQLGHALMSNQNVAGLEVAMHDQLLVRVLHGVGPARYSITMYGRPSSVEPPS
jgi:hypothetical protein